MRCFRSYRWWFRFYGFEFGIMRVVTIYAKEIGPFPSLEIANSFPMNSCLPVVVNIPMALPAKPVGFGKIDVFAIGKLQLVTVTGIMAIEAPPFLLRMAQFDGGMLVL
ncbi:MAG: hypothetical protein A2V87_04640 [Deltaproteobacteria bacterium RBG_16_58_17]|nr:MAG: hypothetical protein A2V87_04640 [Deltaproteobacteria bacterium RBG_16_58_17]